MYMSGPLSVRMRDGHTEQVEYDPLNAFDSGFQGRFSALLADGGIPLRSDGNPWAMVPAVGGGHFWDGCPLNVAYEESAGHSRDTWIPSQVEVMKAANIQPYCLVPGSPNYQAFYGESAITPDSGTGIRTTVTPTVTGGAQILFPTGVPTPTVIPQPGGSTYYVPAPGSPEANAAEIQQAALVPEEEGSWWAWLLAAAFILPKVGFLGYGGYKYVKYRQGKGKPKVRARKRPSRRR